MRPAVLLPAFGLLLALCGCSDDASTPRADSAAAAPVVARPPASGDPSCPSDGTWKPCALLDRVTKAGLAFKPAGDTMRVAFLRVPGIRYQVGRSAVLVAFFYADSAALRRDYLALDTVRLRPASDTTAAWPSAPTVIRSANLLAVVLDGSATQVERLQLAITAGAPQPSAPAAPALLPTVPNAR